MKDYKKNYTSTGKAKSSNDTKRNSRKIVLIIAVVIIVYISIYWIYNLIVRDLTSNQDLINTDLTQQISNQNEEVIVDLTQDPTKIINPELSQGISKAELNALIKDPEEDFEFSFQKKLTQPKEYKIITLPNLEEDKVASLEVIALKNNIKLEKKEWKKKNKKNVYYELKEIKNVEDLDRIVEELNLVGIETINVTSIID